MVLGQGQMHLTNSNKHQMRQYFIVPCTINSKEAGSWVPTTDQMKYTIKIVGVWAQWSNQTKSLHEEPAHHSEVNWIHPISPSSLSVSSPFILNQCLVRKSVRVRVRVSTRSRGQMGLIQSLKLATILMAISCSVHVHVQALNIGVQSVNSGIAAVRGFYHQIFLSFSFLSLWTLVGVYGLRFLCRANKNAAESVNLITVQVQDLKLLMCFMH